MNTGNVGSHNVMLYDKERIEVTGVGDVESFNETEIILALADGGMAIDGEGLKIESFSTTAGTLTAVGGISGICYFGKKTAERGGLFGKHKK